MKVLYEQSLSSYIDSLQAKGRYYFLRSEAINVIGFSPQAFKLAYYRLQKKGRVKRVRDDFFIIIPLEYQSGGLPASWFIDDFMKNQNIHYYVGILTAAGIHGASHQQPMVFQVIANKQMRPILIGKVRIEFYYNKHSENVSIVSVKTETGYMNVSAPEATAYDLVRYMGSAGQINNVATVLTELSQQINMEKFLQWVRKGGLDISVLQRLGYLFEYLKMEFPADEFSKFISEQKPKYRLLAPGKKDEIIEKNKTWKIIVNEQVEPD